jgi:hypothetical protein
MNKRKLMVGLVALCLVASGVGFAVSQLLLERSITGSVTVASQPDLYIMDEQNKPVSNLDFGSLTNGVHLTRTVKLVNMGNAPLKITGERTDAVAGISSVFKRQDNSVYDNASPTTLGMGESLYLKIDLWNSVALEAGAYSLSFKFSGSS